MAKIPRYVGRESLTKEAPSGLMKTENSNPLLDAKAVAGASMGADMKKLGEVASFIGQKVRAVQNSNDESKGNIYKIRSFAAYRDEADKNPEPKHAMDDFESVMANNKEEYLSMFDDPMMRSKASQSFDYDAAKFEVGLRADMFKKEAAEAKVNAISDLGLMGEMLATLEEGEPREQLLDAMKKKLDDLEKLALIYGPEKDKIYQDTLFNSAKRAILNDSDAVKAELDQADGGMYSNIAFEERDKLLSQIRKQEAIDEALRKQVFEEKRYLLNNLVMNNDIDEEEIDQLIKANEVDPDAGIPANTGKILKDALYRQITGDIKSVPQAKKYIKAVNTIFSKEPDRIKAYDALLEAYDGTAKSKEETAYLNQLIKTKNLGKDYEKTTVWQIFRAMIGFQKPSLEDEVIMTKRYIEKIRRGIKPVQAVQEVAYDQQVANHPALAVNPEEVTAIFEPGKGITYLPAKKPKE